MQVSDFPACMLAARSLQHPEPACGKTERLRTSVWEVSTVQVGQHGPGSTVREMGSPGGTACPSKRMDMSYCPETLSTACALHAKGSLYQSPV